MAMTKKQQQQVLLGVLLPGVFIYFWWNYLMIPTTERIKTASQEVQSVEEQVETMKRTAARLPALEREYEMLVTEVGKAEKKLPKQKNLEEIIRVFTEQSQKNKIWINSFAPESERPQNYFVEIPFGISFTANFHSLARFLTVLGQQERIMAAKNLSITFGLNAKRGHTVSGTFSLLAYIFKG